MGFAVSTGTKVKYGTRDSDIPQPCTICLVVKQADEFPTREGGKRQSRCKDCRNLWRKEYRASRKENTRAEYRRDNLSRACKKFGITVDQFFTMYEEQEGRCAICSFEFVEGGGRGKAPAIDHCHTSGKVRALLCVKCNTAIGLLNENIKTFNSAINYLQTHAETTQSKDLVTYSA